MEGSQFCKEHTDVVAGISRIEEKQNGLSGDIKRLDDRVNGTFKRIGKHVDEGDKPGGFRERLVRIETLVATATQEKLNTVKASQWRIGIIAGLPGAILAIIMIVVIVFKVRIIP